MYDGWKVVEGGRGNVKRERRIQGKNEWKGWREKGMEKKGRRERITRRKEGRRSRKAEGREKKEGKGSKKGKGEGRKEENGGKVGS